MGWFCQQLCLELIQQRIRITDKAGSQMQRTMTAKALIPDDLESHDYE